MAGLPTPGRMRPASVEFMSMCHLLMASLDGYCTLQRARETRFPGLADCIHSPLPHIALVEATGDRSPSGPGSLHWPLKGQRCAPESSVGSPLAMLGARLVGAA